MANTVAHQIVSKALELSLLQLYVYQKHQQEDKKASK